MTTKEKRTSWKLSEWNARALPSMTLDEVRQARAYLRDNNYPKPEDCENEACPGFRPACIVGICYIATRMCGDF